MAKFILLNPVCTINGVDLSDHFSSVEINTERDEVDMTAFGATNKEILGGLGSATMTFEAFQDFAAAKVDATIWPLVGSNTGVVISVKATNAATSATNPLYSMTGIVLTYSPIAGSIGEASTTTLEFVNAAQAGLTRATA